MIGLLRPHSAHRPCRAQTPRRQHPSSGRTCAACATSTALRVGHVPTCWKWSCSPPACLSGASAAQGHVTLRLTEAGIQALAQAHAGFQAARHPHENLVKRVADQLGQDGRLAWRGLVLRVPLPRALLEGDGSVQAVDASPTVEEVSPPGDVANTPGAWRCPMCSPSAAVRSRSNVRSRPSAKGITSKTTVSVPASYFRYSRVMGNVQAHSLPLRRA